MSDGSNNSFLDSLNAQFIENLDTDSDNSAVSDVNEIADAVSEPEAMPFNEVATDDEPLFEIIHQPDAIPQEPVAPAYQEPENNYAPVSDIQPIEETESYQPQAEEEPVAAKEPVSDDDGTVKDSLGKKAGRIIVSILLGITVAIFVFGCYTAAFLDKNAVYVFGYSFASVKTDADVYGLKKGDLLIVKRTEAEEFATDDLIVTKADALSAEYLQRVENVGTDTYTGETRISASTNFMGVKQTNELSPDFIVGVCSVYLPVFAGVINFAIANWIYVYILFALLLSFWILLLVLFKKKKN